MPNPATKQKTKHHPDQGLDEFKSGHGQGRGPEHQGGEAVAESQDRSQG